MRCKSLTKQAVFILLFIFTGIILSGYLVFKTQQQMKSVRILRLPHTVSPDHPVHKALEFLAKKVEEKSNGRLKIQIYPSAQMGGEGQIKEMMQLGRVDIGKFSAAAFEDNIPQMAMFSLPFLFENEKDYWEFLNSKSGKKLLDAGYESQAKIKGLCFYDAGARCFYSSDKLGAFNTPEAIKDRKIRVMTSALMVGGIKALGASPISMPYSELYTALQTGIADAAENNLPSYWTSRHYEVCKTLTLSEHFRTPDILVINRSTWEAMSEEDRQILTDVANESSLFQRDLWKKDCERITQDAEKNDVKIVPLTEEQRKTFIKMTEPFYQEVEKSALENPKRKLMMDLVKQVKEGSYK